MLDGSTTYRDAFLAGLRPEPMLTVSEWADEHRLLSSKASAEPGPWRTSRTPYLREPMDCLSSSSPVQRVVMMFAAQTGKALALDESIATPSGWTTMGKLRPGDYVFDERGRPTQVLGVSPVMHDHTCYRVVFSDGSEIKADAEHLWTVDEYQHGKKIGSKTITTEHIAGTFKDGKRNRYAIPIAGPLRLPAAELPIHPYALGVWLGDGNSASNQITSHVDEADETAARLTACGHPTQVRKPTWIKGNCRNLLVQPPERSSTHCIRGHELAVVGVYNLIKRGKPATRCAECARQLSMRHQYGKSVDSVLPARPSFLALLRNLNLIKNKHIPMQYLRGSVKQRLELLRGLLDTDGHIDTRGRRCELAFASERLALDAYELVVSLGLKPSFVKRPNHWRISFMAYAERAVFRLARKRKMQPERLGRRTTEVENRRIVGVIPAPSVPVRCIRVAAKSHLFLAGRAMIPTHNTESGSNWLGYVIHHAPGPMLLVQPTVEMAKRLSKQRLESLIDETPVLRERIKPPRSRDSGNTMFSKEFPGGIMVLTGSNSATGLRSMPCRYLFADEVSSWPQDVDGEGDPLTLAERRTTTFARRKILMTSTPTVKGSCRIEAEYERSDQRRYYVPCPSCGAMQWLQWKQMKWENNDPTTARYECEHCNERFSEIYKGQMLNAGQWRATAPGDGKTAGFHLSGLYSPLGWLSWSDMVDDFLRAKSDAPLLKTFVNTRLAETWEEASANKVNANELMERVEAYDHQSLPSGVLLLTAGVDVQDNRLAVSIWGWGRDEESWLVYHTEIWGDPTAGEVWKQLDSVLTAKYFREDKRELEVVTACVDSGGHCTAEVYQYCRERLRHNFVAIKGASQRGKPPIGRESKVDLNMRGKTIKRGASVYMVGTDTIKDTLLGRLKHNDPGPGYIHFGKAATYDFFDQLTAERKITRYSRSGMPRSEYVKASNKRNEALDTAVYGYAALHLTYRRFNRTKIWDQLENNPKSTVSTPKAAKPVMPRKSFVHGW